MINTPSELDSLIPAEIKDDPFYGLISQIGARENIRHVLEIGSSAGGGSTEAFVRGLQINPNIPHLYCIEVSKPRFEVLAKTYSDFAFVHCYNMSSVSVAEFPSEDAVIRFYRDESSRLTQFPLDEVVRWLHQDIAYVRDSGVDSGAIERIKKDNGIVDFDLILIDGSEFTGEVEFEKIRGAKIIMLDDICTFKTWNVRKLHGFAIFRKKDFTMSTFEKAEPRSCGFFRGFLDRYRRGD